jgi:hypothetical protein
MQMATIGTQQIFRVIQRIDAQRTVELLQWPTALALNEIVVSGGAIDRSGRRAADVADAVASRARQNRAEMAKETDASPVSTLMVRTIGYNVALRGSLSADSLQSLARRVR